MLGQKAGELFPIGFMLTLILYTDACSCPTTPGWRVYSESGKCYFSSTLDAPGGVPTEPKRTLTEATVHCQNLGGDLISVNTEAEQNFMRGTLGADYSTYWLGASLVSDTPLYRWNDGTDVTGSWVPFGSITLPFDSGLISDKAARWVDEYAGNRHHYICEKDPCTLSSSTTSTTTTTPATTTTSTTPTTSRKPSTSVLPHSTINTILLPSTDGNSAAVTSYPYTRNTDNPSTDIRSDSFIWKILFGITLSVLVTVCIVIALLVKLGTVKLIRAAKKVTNANESKQDGVNTTSATTNDVYLTVVGSRQGEYENMDEIAEKSVHPKPGNRQYEPFNPPPQYTNQGASDYTTLSK